MRVFYKLFGRSKGSEEKIAWFDGEDPGMIRAIQEAQSKFHYIEEAILDDSKRVVPAMEECLIKYAVPATEVISVEHLFVSYLYFDGESIKGVVVSNPVYTNIVKYGMEITIDPARVTDWLYTIGGESRGGFTFKYMWKNFTDEEKILYRDQPPFVWLRLA